MIVGGATNKEASWAYLNDIPCPALHPQIIVLNNLVAHKKRGVRAKIEADGRFPLFSPAYKP